MNETIKEFKITFTRCKAGWIDFDVSYGDETISYPFTYIWHSPGDLLRFAQRVYRDNKGILNCDAEGWDWYFDYDGTYLTISDTYHYDDENPDGDQITRFKIPIDKETLCKTIYLSIITFQKSGLYIPEEWERTKPDGYWGEPVMKLKSKLFDKLFQLQVE